MTCGNKTGNTCNIIREVVDDTGAEEVLTESTIYTDINYYTLKVRPRDFTQSLAHETDKNNLLIRVGKKPNIKKGDLVDLSDKDLGDLGRYRVEEIEPKRIKRRLKSIYLYIKKYNG